MTKTLIAVGFVLAVGSVCAGCVVVAERDVPSNGGPQEFEEPSDREAPLLVQEKRLIDFTEEYPERPGVWWALGDFYENCKEYHQALEAYTKMHEALIEVEKEKSEQQGKPVRYTAGPFHLGRICFRLKDYGLAAEWLGKVLELKPQGPDGEQKAALLSHFRESHYILGLIYYNNHDWDLAEDHLTAFVRLGGETERVQHLLVTIEQTKVGARSPAPEKLSEKPARKPK